MSVSVGGVLKVEGENGLQVLDFGGVSLGKDVLVGCEER